MPLMVRLQAVNGPFCRVNLSSLGTCLIEFYQHSWNIPTTTHMSAEIVMWVCGLNWWTVTHYTWMIEILPENWRRALHLVERTDSSNPLFQLANVLCSPWQRPAWLRTMAAFQFVHLHCPAKIPMPQNKLQERLLLIAMWIQYATYCAPSCTLMNFTNVENCQCQMYELSSIHMYGCVQYTRHTITIRATTIDNKTSIFDSRLSTQMKCWMRSKRERQNDEREKNERREQQKTATTLATTTTTITKRDEEMKWNEAQSNINLRLKHNRFGERNAQAMLISVIYMLEYEAAFFIPTDTYRHTHTRSHSHCHTKTFQTNFTDPFRNEPNRTWHQLSKETIQTNDSHTRTYSISLALLNLTRTPLNNAYRMSESGLNVVENYF